MKVVFPNLKKIMSQNSLMNIQKKYFSDNNSPSFYFNYGAKALPHIEKRDKGGEDAFCNSSEVLAVADGVGGWNEVGVDPRLYSQQLCENILSFYNSFKSQLTLKDIFIKACRENKHRGSSTCTICHFSKTESDVLEALNLGDSGYLILRPVLTDNYLDFDIVFKSEEQTHGFNFPFQVGEGGDDPSSAVVQKHKIQENDIVIVATDGLWDNLYPEQICKLLKAYINQDYNKEKKKDAEPVTTVLTKPQEISEVLAQSCQYYSLQQSYNSPFAIRSKGMYLGGKHDDITIVIGQIIKKPNTKF